MQIVRLKYLGIPLFCVHTNARFRVTSLAVHTPSVLSRFREIPINNRTPEQE